MAYIVEHLDELAVGTDDGGNEFDFVLQSRRVQDLRFQFVLDVLAQLCWVTAWVLR